MTSEAANTSRSVTILRHWAGRLYVPVVTLALVLVVGHWLGAIERVDPLTVAQNSRIKFKTVGASGGSGANTLAALEESKAAAVLTRNRTIADDQLKLLYLGNSQTLAIMDEQLGDLTTPQWFQVMLSRQTDLELSRANVILGSEPNITMTELLIKVVASGEQSPRQCDVLLDAAVLEEYRGLGVRDEIASMVDRSAVRAKLKLLLAESSDLRAAANAIGPFVKDGADNEHANASAQGSFARGLEDRLQSTVERNNLFAHRGDLQARIGLGFHAFRNKLLSINSASARPVPESSYRASLELLEMALRYAQAKGIHVVLYLAPIRPVQPNPNLPADVVKFRHDVPELCRRYRALALDYLDLVPENLWTNYSDDVVNSGSQRDYAHFTGAAHKLVAERLITDIEPHLRVWGQGNQTAQR